MLYKFLLMSHLENTEDQDVDLCSECEREKNICVLKECDGNCLKCENCCNDCEFVSDKEDKTQ